MLTKEESEQLKQYSAKDSRLEVLLQRLEEEHQIELSRISHEIRNPVTLINSFLQLTERRYPQVIGFSTWTPIMENLNFLKALLDEFSRYNHAGSVHPEKLYLPKLLESIVQSAASVIPSVSFSFRKLTAIPPTFADATKLKEAILNLVRNSAEALNDQPDGRIEVAISSQNGMMEIQVSNNGPQIPHQQMDNIFEPFVSYKKDGTGLGLPIVKNIVKAHQGTITVSSSPAKTCFTIRIPLVVSFPEAACTYEDRGSR